jgi:hypothetical protein
MSIDRINLDLPREAIADLVAMARLGGKIPQIVEVAKTATPKVGVYAIARELSPALGLARSDLANYIITLLNLYRTKVRLHLSSRKTVDAVSDHILRDQSKDTGETDLSVWNSAKDYVLHALDNLNEDHPLNASSKAYSVATSRQYELVDIRVFTDARPVFNSEGDKIVQNVITYVLSIDYHDKHEHRVIQFSLDSQDLSELKDVITRAEKKTTTIKRDFSTMPWPTIVFREKTVDMGEGK